MRIAILGTRGVPASYSGFETCVEAVGRRLADRGHEVLVYCRSGHQKTHRSYYLGMRLKSFPSIRTKGLDTLSHSAISTVHAILRARVDVALWFGVGNAVYLRPFKWANIPTAINVDGADWARPKWGVLGRSFLRASEKLATRHARALVADSRTISEYYSRRYGADSVFIPYGADVPTEIGTEALSRFGLVTRNYLLAVGRMVPENGFHDLMAAYRDAGCHMPLVVVGDAPYSETYKRALREMAPPGTIFTGYQFGAAYHELSRNAYAFLFGARVGGTHPVLVEQLAHGNCVVARWTESNAEVIADAGMLFHDQTELTALIRSLTSQATNVEKMRIKALSRARLYSWDAVSDAYESVLTRRRDM